MWVSSAEFAVKFGFNKKSLEKSCFRASKVGKKICTLKSNILVFVYSHGVGGYSGKVLKIWDKPFESERDAELFLDTECRRLITENGVDCFANARNDKVRDTSLTLSMTRFDGGASGAQDDKHETFSSYFRGCEVASERSGLVVRERSERQAPQKEPKRQAANKEKNV